MPISPLTFIKAYHCSLRLLMILFLLLLAYRFQENAFLIEKPDLILLNLKNKVIFH